MKVNECNFTDKQYRKLISLKKKGIREELINDKSSFLHGIRSVFPDSKITKFDIIDVTRGEVERIENDDI